VVVALEEREARDLKRAADIEHAIARALGPPSAAVHGGGGRRVTETRAQTGSLASLAGAERRAVAALEALRRQQRAHQMMLEDEAEGEEGEAEGGEDDVGEGGEESAGNSTAAANGTTVNNATAVGGGGEGAGGAGGAGTRLLPQVTLNPLT
jgi:hypothetical protein